MNGIEKFPFLNGGKGVYDQKNGTGRRTGKRDQGNTEKESAASYEMSDKAKNYKPEDYRKVQNNMSVTKNEKTKEDTLSDKAKALLAKLRETYGDMDFFVADFSTDEEAQAYHSRSTKQYSCVIDPETLEEMASKEDVKDKYVAVIDGADDQFSKLKEELGEEAVKEIKSFGITVDKEGTVSYSAEFKSLTGHTKKLERSEKKDKAEPKGREKKADSLDKEKTTDKVFASTISELAEKIKELLAQRVAKRRDTEDAEEPKVHVNATV